MDHISTSELQTVNLMQNDEEHESCSATPEPRLVVGKKTVVNIRIRFFLFCLIEAGFIILASVCLARPLPLTFELSDSKIKGGFTIIFIVWHSLAVFAGGNITTDAFSREWSVRSEHLVPGTTDKVSTINSGVLDRTSHSLTKHASSTFRLAFLASLVLMALAHLAPGTISITAIAVPTAVQVARQVSQIDNDNIQQFLISAIRANLIIRVERIEFAPYGLKLPANTLMSLPPSSNESNGTLEYNTDIVEFHHNCRWEAPSIVHETRYISLISAAGQNWSTTELILGGQNQTKAGMLHDRKMMRCSDNTIFFRLYYCSPLSCGLEYHDEHKH